MELVEKIKQMRGFFYRKVSDIVKQSKEEVQLNLPGFALEKTSHIVEFPELKDITKINITYSLIEPFAYANIKWNSQTKELEYLVIEPKMDENDWTLLKKISDSLIELVEVGLTAIRNIEETIKYLEQQVMKVIRESGITITENQYIRIMYYIYKNFVGYNEIETFLQDPNIEDISCDGVGTPIFIIHRKFGSVKTNVSFKNLDDLREFIVKLSERCGRYVSYAEPILDGTLPDGSRVAATLASDVATRGPTFTIRKFSEKPFSPTDQIELGTADADILAYLWYLVEHGASILVVGGVATGKTSFLNTVSMFIPPEAKIVSIEDTREIRIPHQHWIAGLARSGFGIPTASGEKYGEVTLFDLLRESFRQNPDYVIVGEVRGKETYVMFQGMSSGHPSLSTFHAGSIDTVIKRLTTPPIELSPTLIESLDVIIVMIHAREKGKSARRLKEVSEIVSVDSKTQEVKTNTVFTWNPITDAYSKVIEGVKIEKFATARGGTVEEANKEIEERKKVLIWLGKNKVKDYIEVSKYINMYHKEKKKLMEMVALPYVLQKEAEPQPQVVEAEAKPVEVKPVEAELLQAVPSEAPKRRTSILELLGFKLIREKEK